MGNELISIVVPIYNVEKYLRECLDSISEQTYKNFECIMVNDGSTDSSQQIAEEYLEDSRFTLINQSNKGLSGARNTGISHIREESTFVSFVDSDDYIYPDFLETLIEHIEDDVDIIEGMIEYFHDEIKVDNVSHNFEKKVLLTKDDKLGELALNELRVSVFPKLFRKSLLTEDFFPEGWIFEDLAVVPELVSHSRKWIKLPKVIYGYGIRPNSITTKEFSEEKLDVFKIFGKYDLFFKDESDVTKLLVEKIKYLHLNYHDIEFVPENNHYKQLYQQEKQKLLSKIADYESKALISIIVPIYDVENYLRQCLDSIVSQTYQNFECLLINDGSPDSSADICREYVEKDSRFRYFEKENGGLSSARNFGIERSAGAYITFVDSDDWLEHDALDRLYGALKKENADISIGRYNCYDESRCQYLFYDSNPDDSFEVIEGKEIIDREGVEEMRNGNWTVAYLKLFKRELLQDSPFPIGKIAEDTYWTWKMLLRASKVVYLNRCVYWYRVGLTGTLSNTWSEKRIYDEIEAREEKLAILASLNYDLTNHILIYKNRLQRVIAKLEEQNMQFTEIYRRMMEKLSFLL